MAEREVPRVEVSLEEELGKSEEEKVKMVEEVELPVEGTESKCKVLMIRIGRLKDLINIEAIKNPVIKESYQRRAERFAIQILCREEKTNETFEDTIVFSFHPNARYPKIASRYGRIKVGDELNCKIVNGRWKIV